MVTEVRVYVEGGGDNKSGKTEVRKGFSKFLNCFNRKAKIIACGSRNNTYRDFMNGLERSSEAFNILLVDAEDQVNRSPLEHLRFRDSWELSGIDNEQCHLMVQMMEAWLIADLELLTEFYGQNFNPNPIPKRQNVEAIPRKSIEDSLKAATRNTSKGEYHKIKHGPKILAQVNPQRVRQRATHCDSLFKVLENRLA